MAYQQRPNSGTLFKNDRKEPGSNAPDYRGDAEIDGQVKEISAWIKKSRDGTKTFMSLSFKPKQARPSQGGAAPTRGIDPADVPGAQSANSGADSIPF